MNFGQLGVIYLASIQCAVQMIFFFKSSGYKIAFLKGEWLEYIYHKRHIHLENKNLSIIFPQSSQNTTWTAILEVLWTDKLTLPLSQGFWKGRKIFRLWRVHTISIIKLRMIMFMYFLKNTLKRFNCGWWLYQIFDIAICYWNVFDEPLFKDIFE